MARIEIRVKRSQGLTPDCFSRARCRVRRSVRGCALGSADCSENRESEAAGQQAQGCGSPRSLGVRSSWRPEDTDSCSVLKTRGVPPAPRCAPPVQREHPNSLEQKLCQMESDVQKLGHRSNTMDSRRSWTTREWVMQPDVPRPSSSQT